MRKSLSCFALSLSILTAGIACGEESLLFNASQKSAPAARNATASNTQASDLCRSLNSAGYSPKQTAGDALSFTMQVNEVSVPVVISSVENGEQLRVTLLLSSLADARQVPQAKLLKLLARNRNQQSATFTYNEQLQQIELHRVMPVENARGIQLRDELDLLADLASQTEKLWNLGETVAELEGEQVSLGIQKRSQLPIRKVSLSISVNELAAE